MFFLRVFTNYGNNLLLRLKKTYLVALQEKYGATTASGVTRGLSQEENLPEMDQIPNNQKNPGNEGESGCG